MGVAFVCKRVAVDKERFVNRRTGNGYVLECIHTSEGVVYCLRSEDGDLNVYASRRACLRLMEYSETLILG